MAKYEARVSCTIFIIMRADISEPNDEVAVTRFHKLVHSLGAELEEKRCPIGVDLLKLKI